MITIWSILTLIWLPQALYQILNFSYWLQVKEYRFDRFWSFLKSGEGKRELHVKFILTKYIVIALSLIFFEAFLLTILLFLIEDIRFVLAVITKKARKPVLTQRGKRIVGTTAVLLVIASVNLVLSNFINISFILAELAIVIGPVIGILWTAPVVKRIKYEELAKAKKILHKINPLVIGITGSYGKTTTKDFIAHLLSEKFAVEKTFKNENTEFGIARRIINSIKAGIQVFVVEMGAYKKGEIRKLADIVNPTYAVITGIEFQHVDLFGSLENIKDAKYELIESLPDNGTVLINMSSYFARDIYKRALKENKHLKVLIYYLHKKDILDKINFKPHMQSFIKKADVDGVTFEITDGDVTKQLSAPVYGSHFIENLTGAILIARELGVGWKQIELLCKSIKTPENTMQITQLSYGAVVIDDTYNTTPKAFLAALGYLNYFKGKKKVVVTRGISELGAESENEHKKIGKLVDTVVNYIVVTDPQNGKFIKSGMRNSDSKLVVITDIDKLIKTIEKYIEEGAVILLEGKVHQSLTDFVDQRKLK